MGAPTSVYLLRGVHAVTGAMFDRSRRLGQVSLRESLIGDSDPTCISSQSADFTT